MSVNSSLSHVTSAACHAGDSPALAEEATASTACVPQMKSVEKASNPFGSMPRDPMYRIFEDLIDVRTPLASVLRLSRTCRFFRGAVGDFMRDHSSGQQLKTRLKLFAPRQPFSDLFISQRSVQLKNNFLAQRLFEDIRATSFPADKNIPVSAVIKKLERHVSRQVATPFRLAWPMEGGWWGASVCNVLRACQNSILNMVFNDTLHPTLVNEMFPALSACSPGCSVILELRRTELDDALLLALGQLCHEHPVIYQISLQSWKPEVSGSLGQFLSNLMRLPGAVQIVDMSYGTPVTDDVAAAITAAVPLLVRPIELRFPTRDLSEASMEALIRAVVKRNASGAILCKLKLLVGEDMYRPKSPPPNALYLDGETKASLKFRGVQFSKLRGYLEGKDPAFLFWL